MWPCHNTNPVTARLIVHWVLLTRWWSWRVAKGTLQGLRKLNLDHQLVSTGFSPVHALVVLVCCPMVYVTVVWILSLKMTCWDIGELDVSWTQPCSASGLLACSLVTVLVLLDCPLDPPFLAHALVVLACSLITVQALSLGPASPAHALVLLPCCPMALQASQKVESWLPMLAMMVM